MIKVLVVDDSLFMRKLISRMLSSDPQIEVVDTAKNGFEAVEMVLQRRPDVVTLDINMPGLDGLATLKKIMAKCPTPAVIISAHTKKDADITLQCLEEGAVGYILKPSGELSLDIEKVKDALFKEIRAAVEATPHPWRGARPGRAMGRSPAVFACPPLEKRGAEKVVVIGASTGGPPAVEAVLSRLPADFPSPIVVVQHTPSLFFAESFTERLKKTCCLDCKVVEQGEQLKAGTVYVVPHGFSLTLADEGFVSLREDAPDSLSPSIDATMTSLAERYRHNVIGIILTGIGNDGLRGMKVVKDEGGVAIAQDEATSLIFGMPAAIAHAGLADMILPLEKIAEELIIRAYSG